PRDRAARLRERRPWPEAGAAGRAPGAVRAGRRNLPRPAGAAARGEPALREPARPRAARPIDLGLVPVPPAPALPAWLLGLQARLRHHRRLADVDRPRAGASGL